MGKVRDGPEIERGEKTISSDKDHKQNLLGWKNRTRPIAVPRHRRDGGLRRRRGKGCERRKRTRSECLFAPLAPPW